MTRLDKFVAEVVSAIKSKYPFVNIKIMPPYETEDVDLEVYAPKDQCFEIHEFAADLTYNIAMEEGYNIAVLVMPFESAQKYGVTIRQKQKFRT